VKKLVFYTCELEPPFKGVIAIGENLDIFANNATNVYEQTLDRIKYSDVLIPESDQNKIMDRFGQNFDCSEVKEEYKMPALQGEGELAKFQRAIKIVAVYDVHEKSTEPENKSQENQESIEKPSTTKSKNRLKFGIIFVLLVLVGGAGGTLLYQQKINKERYEVYKGELDLARKFIDNRNETYHNELKEAKKLASTTPASGSGEVPDCKKDDPKVDDLPCMWEVGDNDTISGICFKYYSDDLAREKCQECVIKTNNDSKIIIKYKKIHVKRYDDCN
jgi:hypothetical protein